MATFDTKRIRNIALVGHGGSGKTSLAESMLYKAGVIDRVGKISDGNTVCDYDPEEVRRGFSLSASLCTLTWKDVKINLLDTPGYLDFVGEVNQALRVADNAIIVVDGKAGVEVGTELAWEACEARKLPRAFFVNKCDDPEAKFENVFNQLHFKFGKAICPVFVPVKEGDNVTMVDLISMTAFHYDAKGVRTEAEMKPEYETINEQYKQVLTEAIAETDEALMEKYFNGDEITREEAVLALHNGIIDGSIVPVYCGASTNMWGVIALLDAIQESFPRHTAKKTETDKYGDPVEIDPAGNPAIFVFKTVADPFVGKMSFFKVMNGSVRRDMTLRNTTTGSTEKLAHLYAVCGKNQSEVDELACGDIGMIAKLTATNTNDTLALEDMSAYAPIAFPNPYLTQAMIPATAKDEGKISQSIAKMLEEDQTLRYENDPETKQMLISALGDMHLAVLAAKLKARFGVTVNFEAPRMAYREKITRPVDVEGKHKKQTGGSGQYGHVKIRFSPADSEGLTFTVSVVGGTVPKNFYPAVEKGLTEAMTKGAVGFPLVGLCADLYDGSYHEVDSDEISFKLAANLAYKECLKKASPVLLEPVGNLDITVPESLVGDVMGDLNKRRGAVMGMDSAEKKGYTVVHAIIPKAEIMDYPIALRAMTQGRGSFEYEVTGYDTVPGNVSQKIIAEYGKAE